MKKNKNIVVAAILAFLLLISGCSNNVSDSPSTNNEKIEDNKTYLQIENNSQFDINVYLQSPSYADPYATVKVNESVKKEISASTTNFGDGIYIQYLYNVGNIVIPYYDSSNTACVQIKQINENEVNTIKVSKLTSLTVNTKYLVIKNESESDVALYNDEKNPVTPLYQEKYWIKNNEYRIYELKDVNSLSGYQIGNGLANKNFSIDSVANGNIYSLKYSDSSIDLISISPIDISVQNKIWKIPLSQTLGKYLTADRFASRENISDGYFFTGQISYDSNFRNKQSSAYKAEISPLGQIKDEVVTMKDAPAMVWSRTFIEKNGYRIVAGTKINSETEKNEAFIYGEVDCDFYVTLNIDGLFNVIKLIHKEDNTFSLLYNIGQSEEEITGFGIYEFTIESYSEINGRTVYENKTGKYVPKSFIYQNDEYLVLSWVKDGDNASVFYFIKNSYDENNTEEENVEIEFDNYLFDTIEAQSEDVYAVASGSYTNALTGCDEASFLVFDLNTKEVLGDGKPVKFPSKTSSLNSNFNNVSIKNNELFLGGYTEVGDDSAGFPYFVSYNLINEKTNWEHVYEDYEGFEVFSCCLSAIGTPLIELYNIETDMSYLCSCGLLGEIPERTLEPLPRSSKITTVKTPNVEVSVVDADGVKHSLLLPYDTSLSLAELNERIEKIEDFSIPYGKMISGWSVSRDENTLEKENLVFPVKVTGNETIYPVFCLAPPTNLTISELEDCQCSFTWNENPLASYYNIYCEITEEYNMGNGLFTLRKGESDSELFNLQNITGNECKLYFYPLMKANFYICSVDANGEEGVRSEPVYIEGPLPAVYKSGYSYGDGQSVSCNVSDFEGHTILRIYFKYETEITDSSGMPVKDLGNWGIGQIFYKHFNDESDGRSIEIKAPGSLKLGDEFYIDYVLTDFDFVMSDSTIIPYYSFLIGIWNGCSFKAYLF